MSEYMKIPVGSLMNHVLPTISHLSYKTPTTIYLETEADFTLIAAILAQNPTYVPEYVSELELPVSAKPYRSFN